MNEEQRPSCNIEDMEHVKEVVAAFLDSDDPLGSYTGNPEDGLRPTQDADDL